MSKSESERERQKEQKVTNSSRHTHLLRIVRLQVDIV